MNGDHIIVACPNCGTKNRIPKARLNDRPLCGKCHSTLALGGGDGKPIEVTDATFDKEVLSYPGPVLVDFWAPWCGPCRMVGPIVEQLASAFRGKVKVGKLNVDQNPVTASRFQIQSIPTLLFFKNGQLVEKLVGAVPAQEIESRLRSLLQD